MVDKCESKIDFEDFKKDYEIIREKYNLPSFQEMNENFQIEKVIECETEFLIKEIRKNVSEKFSNYLRFVEILLHPVSAPIFVFSVLKAMTLDEKNKLTKAYTELAKLEISAIKLDLVFSEEKEAEFIKDSYEIWKRIREDILEVIEIIEKNWDNKIEVNNKGYFG
jgi:hypothetical protein